MGNLSATLPPDLLEAQLATVDLLRAMFPGEKGHYLSPADIALLENMRSETGNPKIERLPKSIEMDLYVVIEEPHFIHVNVAVPLCTEEPEPMEPPPITFSLRQPNWLNRAQLSALSAQLPPDIFSALEDIPDLALPYVQSNIGGTDQTPEPNRLLTPLIRVWFYFPSLSTREKRNHMVQWAPGYNLTGFVLAGKPGMLCLEGSAGDIDAYMNEIKTVSWGDIPSHQKKVSERYRETGEGPGGIVRSFSGMEEITDKVGERHGARGNRGDMAAIEAWLKGKGLGEMFETVILQA